MQQVATGGGKSIEQIPLRSDSEGELLVFTEQDNERRPPILTQQRTSSLGRLLGESNMDIQTARGPQAPDEVGQVQATAK